MYDIILMHIWISFDIIGLWYQNTHCKLSTMISDMVSSCIYSLPKQNSAERCRSRVWQHPTQKEQNWLLWFDVLPDKAWAVLVVWRNRRVSLTRPIVVVRHRLPWWTRRRCSAVSPGAGAGSGGGSWAAAVSSRQKCLNHPAILLVRSTSNSQLLVLLFWLDAVCRVVLLEVELAACTKSLLSWNPCTGERYLGYIMISWEPPTE